MKSATILGTAALAALAASSAWAALWDGAPDGGGSSPDKNWSTGQNWVGDTAPANPASETIVFTNSGSVADATLTSVMDVDWEIGGLTIKHTGGNHNLDLGSGRRLTAKGNAIVGYNVGTAATAVYVTNGVLQIGTAGAKKDLVIGRRDWSFPKPDASLTLNNCTLDANLSNLWVGVECSLETGCGGTLDLQNATIAGGRLACEEIAVGTGPGGVGTVKLSNNTGLTSIEAVRQFQLGARTTAAGSYKACGGTGKIGVAPNYTNLPDGVSITLGQWGTTRCEVGISMKAWADAGGAPSVLVASTNGAFTGYISTATVGQIGYAIGTVDLRKMTNVTIDALAILISRSNANNDAGRGYIHLPKGTVNTRYLSVSPAPAFAWPEGLFQMNGTVCRVASNVTFGGKGTLEANIAGLPCGLDLGAAATLISTTNGNVGRINLVFRQNPSDSESPYWGLRWAGNHVTELQDLRAVGKLAWDDTTYMTAPYQGKVAIGVQAGYTYVGIIPPPRGALITLR